MRQGNELACGWRRALGAALVPLIQLAAMGSSLALAPVRAATTPPTLSVNTTADAQDASPCTGSNPCSLRDAVGIADANSGSTIVIPYGEYLRNGSLGELRISASMTLKGAGGAWSAACGATGSTCIFGSFKDLPPGSTSSRVLEITDPNATVTMSDLQFGSGNSDMSGSSPVAARPQGAGEGGGILNKGTLILTDSTVTGSRASLGGGGIANYGTLNLTNSTISGNCAPHCFPLDYQDRINGGASDGSATSGGGGLLNYGQLSLVGSSVAGNISSTDGGGILNAGQLTLTNSTVSGNHATTSGGGISNRIGGTAMALNATVANNTAPAASGVDASLTGNKGGVSLRNTILANNDPTTNCLGIITSNGHNLDTGVSCGFAATTNADRQAALDARLGPLQDNGGPTPTQALLVGSSAVDAGDSAVCGAVDQRGVVVDQRGMPRFPLGDSSCDIGAFELQPATVHGEASAVRVEGLRLAGGAPQTKSLCEASTAPGADPAPGGCAAPLCLIIGPDLVPESQTSGGGCAAAFADTASIGGPSQMVVPDGHGGVTSDSSLASVRFMSDKPILEAKSLRATTHTTCDASGLPTSTQAQSSMASLSFADIPGPFGITFPNSVDVRPVGSRIVFNPTGRNPITLYGNPIRINPTGGRIPMAIVTLNYSRYDPTSTRQVSSAVEIEFPSNGPLSKLIVGRVFLAHASSGCR